MAWEFLHIVLTTKVQEDFKLPSTTGPNTNQ